MRTTFSWLWLVGLVTIFGLSLVPHLITTPHNSDKFLHVNAYCLLMTGVMVLTHRWKIRFAAIMFLSSLGVVIEYLQGVVGGRQVSAYDAAANVAGIALGVVIGWLCDKGLRAHPSSTAAQRRKE